MKKSVSLGVALAASLALALTACGGGGAKGPEVGQGESAGGDLGKLIQTNPKDVKDLDQGGTLTVSVGDMGPNFNGFSNDGNTANNTALTARECRKLLDRGT